LTLVRHYDRDNDGKIMYAEFCDALLSKNRPANAGNAIDEGHFIADESKVDSALALMLEKLGQLKDVGIRAEFRSLDKDGSGKITLKEILDCLFKFNIDLDADEEVLLMSKFDKNMDGTIDFNEFCDAIVDSGPADQSYEQKNDEGKFGEPMAHRPRTPMMKDYKKKLLEAQRQETDEHDLKLCMKAFTCNFYSRKFGLRKQFLNFDLDQEGVICKEEFEEALSRANNDFSQKWKKVLLSYFFPTEGHMLKYDVFMEMMFKQDINNSVALYGRLHGSTVDNIRL